MHVVPLQKPDESEEIVHGLERLVERVRDGEFEAVVVIAFAPNGSWLVKELGKSKGKLEKIGMLECLKMDYIQSTETTLPSGL